MEKLSLVDIINQEKNHFFNAKEKYGDYFLNALDFNALLQAFVKEITKPEIFIFVSFLSFIKKHHTLAMLSAVRLHHVQCYMNLRQVLEATANAAYAIANPNINDFCVENENKTLEAPRKLADKRNKWLQENYPDGNDAIKRLKNLINKSCAHANIVYVQKNFKLNSEEKIFETPFFDIEDIFHTKSDLWFIANVAMGLMDLFYGVNINKDAIIFCDNFIERLNELKKTNDNLKITMLSDSRFDYLKSQGAL